MPKLSDTQAILLSPAAHRHSGSLYPLPKQLTPNGGIIKSMAALVNDGVAEERETSDPTAVSRTNRALRYSVFVTAADLQAIGIEPESGAAEEATTAESPVADKPERRTRAAEVLAMLGRTEGATLTAEQQQVDVLLLRS